MEDLTGHSLTKEHLKMYHLSFVYVRMSCNLGVRIFEKYNRASKLYKESTLLTYFAGLNHCLLVMSEALNYQAIAYDVFEVWTCT